MTAGQFAKATLYPFRPVRGTAELMDDPGSLAGGLLIYTILGLAYTLTVVIAAGRGFGAVVTPFLNIPAEDYYLWERWFALPVYLISLIVFAGTARLLSAAMGGKGRFEFILAVYAFAMFWPVIITMWLPETWLMVIRPDARAEDLGGFSGLPTWIDVARQVIGIIWPAAVTIAGVRSSENIGWFRAVVAVMGAMVPTVAFILVFIR